MIARLSFRWWTVGLLAVMLCVRAVPSAAAQPDLEARWVEVNALLARQAWREALEALDGILRATPKDPKALAWRRLCQKRLSEGVGFRVLSPREEQIVRDTLRQEQRAQHDAAAARKALDRQLKREQKRWDAELTRLHRQTVQEERTRARREQREAARLPRARGGQAQRTRPTPAPSEPAVPAAPPSTQQSIELAPVTVTVAPPVPEVEEVAPVHIPSPAEVPPGAVQIFADQLTASTDRRLAVARGHVHVVFSDGTMTCDHATLFTDTKDVYAEGRVRLERGNEVFRGELVHYNTETKKGRFLEGTSAGPLWVEHGRVAEHIAESVLQVKAGYVTTCNLDPPHFRFQSRTATLFVEDKIVRGRNVTLVAEEFPIIYLPWLSVADRQSPFFLLPGKNKQWGYFGLGGYRYEWPPGNRGTIRLDWREFHGWGTGLDQRFEHPRWGKGLFMVYYNEERPLDKPESALPKGAGINRYRVLWRHGWRPRDDTTVITDIQEFSDVDFRRDFLFREEYVRESVPGLALGTAPGSFISMVRGEKDFSFLVLGRKRMNRFETVTEAFPDAEFSLRSAPIGGSRVYVESTARAANLQTKRAHSDNDTDVILVEGFQQLSYALGWFRPVLMTPKASVRQTYFTKDIQGGAERLQGQRNVTSRQVSMGTDASLKLFRIFPVVTNWLKLDIHQLRHVLTPTATHRYIRPPTRPDTLLSFPTSVASKNQIDFGLENKLQTKRATGGGKPRSVDLARFIIGIPYVFKSHTNKRGGELGDWSFDLEMMPWPWLRIESDWVYPAHDPDVSRDSRITTWNLDIGIAGGRKDADASRASSVSAYQPIGSEEIWDWLPSGIPVLPVGQWNLGLSRRFSHNDKTEDILQLDWRVSRKWQLNAFQRFTEKQVAGTSKRFRNVREYQVALFRDLHDWVAEFVYRVDREFGEELFFRMTLKAFPNLPFELEDTYHQPKIGSQSSPFSSVP